jgi:hypothetical protein
VFILLYRAEGLLKWRETSTRMDSKSLSAFGKNISTHGRIESKGRSTKASRQPRYSWLYARTFQPYWQRIFQSSRRHAYSPKISDQR